jgi:hypothetical protein
MKKIYLILLLILGACTSDEFEPIPETVVFDTFAVAENIVKDKGTITFTLEKEGTYILTLSDGNQVISREKFVGKQGRNNLTLYTRTIQSKYLYLVLQDTNNNQIGKTTIIIK